MFKLISITIELFLHLDTVFLIVIIGALSDCKICVNLATFMFHNYDLNFCFLQVGGRVEVRGRVQPVHHPPCLPGGRGDQPRHNHHL